MMMMIVFIITPLRIFQISVRWRFSTKVWVRVTLLKSSGLFSVFWSISTNAVVWMNSIYPLISNYFQSLYQSFPRAPITISISVTFKFHSFLSSQVRSRYLSLFSLSHYSAGSLFFCWLSVGLVVWPELVDLFVSQNPRECCSSHFPIRILGWAYTICSYSQI